MIHHNFLLAKENQTAILFQWLGADHQPTHESFDIPIIAWRLQEKGNNQVVAMPVFFVDVAFNGNTRVGIQARRNIIVDQVIYEDRAAFERESLAMYLKRDRKA
jgi:hypothetical protein